MWRFPKNVPSLLPILSVTAALSPLVASSVVRSAEGPQSTIVFVCEHGSSKSVVAAELFNRAAAQRGIPVRAISRAVSEKTVEAAVPARLVRSLSGDGFDDATFRPQPLTAAEAKNASHVVVINYDADVDAADGRALEHWTIVHPVTLEYDGAKGELSSRIDALMQRLTAAADSDGPR
jgi:protein-tyrosine-phosphatase